ncbi:MAG: hypothetical protein R2710_03855 [Acidimicrobiales bacterium]
MERTKGRPLVTGELQPTEALVFAVGLEIISFIWLWGFPSTCSAPCSPSRRASSMCSSTRCG